MYDLPSIEGVAKVVVDEKTITEDKKPLIVYKSDATETTEELKAS
jgi:ATP-dependent Clp protease ATP-binding subunit ClpX